MMVYRHHEHIDGNGYPVGRTGEDIHVWANILAVVDVFESLTGERPYRTPATEEGANQFLLSRAGTQFDEDITRCWVSAIQKQ